MFEWWRRRATAAELMVARTILEASGDHRAEALFEQLRASRRIERHVEGATLRVVVPWTTEDLMVDLDEDVVSDPVGMRDLLSGKVLRFRVHLARGGFFRCLEGQADPRWPSRWKVDPDGSEVAAGALRLPEEPTSDALAEWLGIPIADGSGVTIHQPAPSGAIDTLPRRETLALPRLMREFLTITDGMLVGGWAILGVRDLCVVEVAGVSCWQVAVGTDSADDRRCLLRPDGALVIVPVHDAPADDLERVSTDLREWIAGLVGG